MSERHPVVRAVIRDQNVGSRPLRRRQAGGGLIWEWDRQGRPAGPTPFTSFPEWARVAAGILVACGLGDPCLPQNDGTFTRDTVTDDMTTLFRLADSIHGDDWITSRDLRELVSPGITYGADRDNDLFPQWDLRDRKGQTAFGMALQRYKGRILGCVRMEVDESDRNRRRYRFQLQDSSQAGNGLPEDQSCGPCRPCGPQTQAEGEGGVPTRSGKQVSEVHKVHRLGRLEPLLGQSDGVAIDPDASTGEQPGPKAGRSQPPCLPPELQRLVASGAPTLTPALLPDPALN